MESDVERKLDLIFGKGGGRDLRCDVYTPQAPSAHRSAVLMLYGGGWQRGEKSMMQAQAEYLARCGYVCVAAEYRLTPEAPWPAQIHDVKAALRWLRAHAASLNVDADSIAVLGNSAGGHLALVLAGTAGLAEFEGDGGNAGIATHVAACVAWYPPTLFYAGTTRMSGAIPADTLLGDAATEATARAVSTTTYVHPHFPPTFFQHGTADKVVPVTASLRMYEALAKAGVRAEIHLYAEQPHSWARQPNWFGPAMAEAALFLDRYVAHPHAWSARQQAVE